MADQPINTNDQSSMEGDPVEEMVQPVEQTENSAPVNQGSGDDWDEEVDDFIGAAGNVELPDPNSVVTIRTSGGGDKYVPVNQPTSVKDVIAQSGLFFGGAVQYWLNGAQVNQDTLVPGGSTLSVIGSVKGG